jgi:branched-chain amino acid transport system substrate-binding protein
VLAFAAVLALVAAGCGDGNDSEETPQGGTEGDGPSGDPIVVGSTLALTGPLAPTAAIHQVVGDLFVEQLNESGGLLGRPVEWRVLDDEGVPDRAAALYERLITEDEVDLIIGPYGTGAITAAMQVAERYGYVFPQHTGSLTYAYTYGCQFPAWPTGVSSNITNPTLVYDALESTGNPPESIGFVVNQFPGTMFISYGPPDSDEGGAVRLAEERGYDVVLDVQFPTDISDWGPIAAQVREADPDFVYVAGLGLDGPNLIEAMEAIDYRPDGMFVQWPAPGPLLGVGEPGDGVMSVTAFEAHQPFTDDPEGAAAAEAFEQAAAEAGLPYTKMETQASASWAAWQILVAGFEGAGDLDHQAACDHLVNNDIETIFGTVDFGSEANNYYGDLSYIKQIQEGDWWVVYPPEMAAPDRSVVFP